MAHFLLSSFQYRILAVLVGEGGMTFAALFERVHALSGAEAPAVLEAAQALYDLSLVDVRRAADASSASYIHDLTPDRLFAAYRHLDRFSAAAVVARGGEADPFYIAASHLGLGECARPEYAERAQEEGPPGELPTLPFP